MAVRAATRVQSAEPADKLVRHSGILPEHLQTPRQQMYPPGGRKSIRNFMIHEVSRLTSIPESTLKFISNDGKSQVPVCLENNHRVDTLAHINELRELFAAQRTAEALRFLPHR